MTRHDSDPPPLQDPLAEIERHLMAAFLAGAGHDLNELLTRTDEEAHALLAEASRYASGRLSEMQARAQYVHALHGDA